MSSTKEKAMGVVQTRELQKKDMRDLYWIDYSQDAKKIKQKTIDSLSLFFPPNSLKLVFMKIANRNGYSGSKKDGKPHGYGAEIRDGESYHGEWKNGFRDGNGVSYYRTPFPEWAGKLSYQYQDSTLAEPRKFCGVWRNGKPYSGKGSFFIKGNPANSEPDSVFRGEMQEGKFYNGSIIKQPSSNGKSTILYYRQSREIDAQAQEKRCEAINKELETTKGLAQKLLAVTQDADAASTHVANELIRAQAASGTEKNKILNDIKDTIQAAALEIAGEHTKTTNPNRPGFAGDFLRTLMIEKTKPLDRHFVAPTPYEKEIINLASYKAGKDLGEPKEISTFLSTLLEKGAEEVSLQEEATTKAPINDYATREVQKKQRILNAATKQLEQTQTTVFVARPGAQGAEVRPLPQKKPAMSGRTF